MTTPTIRPLTEAQAKEIAWLWSRGKSFVWNRGKNPTHDSLVDKRLVDIGEPAVCPWNDRTGLRCTLNQSAYPALAHYLLQNLRDSAGTVERKVAA